MIGAIAGDIIGSLYEWDNIKTKEFVLFSQGCFFTDDTVLTVALADSILTGTPYAENMKRFYHRKPLYSGRLRQMLMAASDPIQDWVPKSETMSGKSINHLSP